MKSYPSIDKKIIQEHIFAFDKLDGSNIRAEWTKKTGFSKFGSRTRLLDPNEKPLGEAVELIQNKYLNSLSSIFDRERYQSVVCFFEFFGPNSDFGQHREEKHDVVLIDIDVYKRGLLPAREFISLFENVHIPDILYEGNPTQEFVDSVFNSTLEGMTLEGVVCKGNINRKTKLPTMFKIKSNRWLEKLKSYCKDDVLLFNKLA